MSKGVHMNRIPVSLMIGEVWTPPEVLQDESHWHTIHFPKSQKCSTCQLADGPVCSHKRIPAKQVGTRHVDLAGPLGRGYYNEQYFLVGIFRGSTQMASQCMYYPLCVL
eukprot:6286461-Amphidinium_carterae.1